ncbi:hypothetical protein Tco_0231717 [Tanacetum coccineum]
MEIMDHEVKRLKQSRIPIIKVQWNSRRGPEFTWEREDQSQKKYLEIGLSMYPLPPHIRRLPPPREEESTYTLYLNHTT